MDMSSSVSSHFKESLEHIYTMKSFIIVVTQYEWHVGFPENLFDECDVLRVRLWSV